MPKKIYFGDFHLLVNEYHKQLRLEEPESHTTEWFLLRYLGRIVKASTDPAEETRVASSINSLVRFYLDNIDEESEHGSICQSIYYEYRKTLKENQDSDS